jgi:SAM-dependent methyltransferase
MQFATWNDIGFGRMSDEIASAFTPLVQRQAAPDDPDWARHVWKRRKRMLRWFVKRRLGKVPQSERSSAAVAEEYDTVWSRGYERYQLHPDVHAKPWIWHAQRYWANSVGATRFRQAILIRMIERLKPRSVLEVGCGNGINLILLACRFPEIAFTGVELTAAGHSAAVQFQQAHETLPAPMQAFAPLPLADPAAFRRIRFVQGSAAELPFEAGAFDLTMTILALEQMERIRPRALSEISRVTAKHAFLLEPFRELNASGWLWLNRMKRDYFAGRIGELAAHGLEPEFAVSDYPQEVFLRTCAVLCRKRA